MAGLELYGPGGGPAVNELLAEQIRALTAAADRIVAGAGGSFTWSQAAASTVWDFDHPLGYHPAVSVVDSLGNDVEGDVAADSTHVRIIFSQAVAGVAYLS